MTHLRVLSFILILLPCAAYADAGNAAPDADPAGDVADAGIAAIGAAVDAGIDATGYGAAAAMDGFGVSQDEDAPPADEGNDGGSDAGAVDDGDGD